MAIRRPDTEDVAALARSYGMHPSDGDVAVYTALIDGALTSYDAVEELYADIAPRVPEGRSGHRPDDADNPLGAWYVTTEIHGAPGGPLAGRTVAVKDNIAVAGVPMMNGSHTLEGFVPEPGRHRGEPAARRRRDDRRQVGLRGPVLLRRQPHLA